MLDQLKKLNNLGLSLIPVAGKRSSDKDGAKRPLVSWQEYNQRKPTETELQTWVNSFPKMDVGVVTGPVSKVLVLDIDGPEGEEAIKQFHIPHTWTVKTKRGRHIYFRWSQKLDSRITTKTDVLPKVDIRGDGGYVIAPPSLGYNGTPYVWQKSPFTGVPLAEVPEWLLILIPSKDKPVNNAQQKSGSWLSDALNSIKEGSRNDSFTRIAGSLRARGYTKEDIYSLLLPRAKELSFSENELLTVCDSIGRYEPGNQLESPGSSIEEFLSQEEKVTWIVPNIISERSIGFVAGLPETMKTWLMIDLAVECAKGGGMWLGKYPAKAAKILFIDQERFKGETQRRFKAIIKAKNISPLDLKGQLYVRCGTSTRIDLQPSYEAFRRELAETRPDVVIIDSFATFHTKEENDRSSIQVVLERIKQMRNEFNCSFIFIDHENKGAFHADEFKEEPSMTRMAGSIAKPAAAEFVLTVRRKGAESFVYHTKSTLASTVAPFNVRVRDVDLEKSKIVVEAL